MIRELAHMPVFWLDVALWLGVLVMIAKNELLR